VLGSGAFRSLWLLNPQKPHRRGCERRVDIMKDAIHNRIMQELTETDKQHSGVHVPKKDKILEWTLYGIFEQLQGISATLNDIAADLRMRPR